MWPVSSSSPLSTPERAASMFVNKACCTPCAFNVALLQMGFILSTNPYCSTCVPPYDNASVASKQLLSLMYSRESCFIVCQQSMLQSVCIQCGIATNGIYFEHKSLHYQVGFLVKQQKSWFILVIFKKTMVEFNTF